MDVLGLTKDQLRLEVARLTERCQNVERMLTGEIHKHEATWARAEMLESRNNDVLKAVVDRQLGIATEASPKEAGELKPMRNARRPWPQVQASLERESKKEYWDQYVKKVESEDAQAMNDPKAAENG